MHNSILLTFSSPSILKHNLSISHVTNRPGDNGPIGLLLINSCFWVLLQLNINDIVVQNKSLVHQNSKPNDYIQRPNKSFWSGSYFSPFSFHPAPHKSVSPFYPTLTVG